MKIKALIKPIAIGLVAYEASRLLIPHYSDIIAIGSGIYLLYNIISDDDKSPFVTSIVYNKIDNKILATVKNPSKNTFAFIPQIRLKEIVQPADSMMTAASIPDKTTLVGETEIPSIIGPNETITVSCNLLIPQEMYENSNGSLSIKLSFEDVKESLNKIASTKVSEKITQIIQKTDALIDVPIPEVKVDIPVVLPNINDKIKEAILIQASIGKPVDHIHYMELAPPETAMAEISKIIKPEVLTDSLRSASFILTTKHPGKDIGHSQGILKLIVAMDRLKAINIGNDAI